MHGEPGRPGPAGADPVEAVGVGPLRREEEEEEGETGHGQVLGVPSPSSGLKGLGTSSS